MNNTFAVIPKGWTKNDLSDSMSDVFDTEKGTRIVITRDCTPCGMYNVYVKANFPEGEGKMLGTRCKYSTAMRKAKSFDDSL